MYNEAFNLKTIPNYLSHCAVHHRGVSHNLVQDLTPVSHKFSLEHLSIQSNNFQCDFA